MASTHGTGRNRTVVTAPDKGSFPLDHFHECEEHAIRYNACLDKHQLMPKRCQKFQINYLECRMKHNLMGKEKIENLGFDDVNTWDNEEKVSVHTQERLDDSGINQVSPPWRFNLSHLCSQS